jgi:hypothetical protein
MFEDSEFYLAKISSEAKPAFDAGSDGPCQPIEENYSGICLCRSDLKQVWQGDLGNCYFFASLIILTERPDLVRGIFIEPVENEVMAVNVNFYWIGERESIIIDSRARFKNSRPNLG